MASTTSVPADTERSLDVLTLPGVGVEMAAVVGTAAGFVYHPARPRREDFGLAGPSRAAIAV
jgi:hypothetical protein